MPPVFATPQPARAAAIPAAAPAPARVAEFDGLRGLLALWVAVSHIVCLGGFASLGLPYPLDRAWSIVVFARPAVDTFIILSGFAITFLLSTRTQSYAQFIAGRFFRIVPVYLVCLAAAAATWLLIPSVLANASWADGVYLSELRARAVNESAHPIAHLFWHLSLLHGAVPRTVLEDAAMTFLAPAWSISLEWQYYLVAPLLAMLVRSTAGWVVLLVAALLGSRLAGLWSDAFLPIQLPLFLVGIASYHLQVRAAHGAEIEPRTLLLAVVAVAIAGLCVRWFALAIWAVGFGCSFSASRASNAARTTSLGAVRRLLLSPQLQYLGRISYPLYLVHWPMIIGMLWLLLSLVPRISPQLALATLMLLGLPLILLCANLLHRGVEVPGMALGRQFVDRHLHPKSQPNPSVA